MKKTRSHIDNSSTTFHFLLINQEFSGYYSLHKSHQENITEMLYVGKIQSKKYDSAVDIYRNISILDNKKD